MIHPVWHFELVRDTNAPLALVREALLNGQNYSQWHPRHRTASPEIVEDGERLEVLCRIHKFGVREEARYIAEPANGRLLLTYRNRFSGWPVILLMGWWRIKSEHIWERFVSSLP
ncbi:MAG: hypothetical protein LBH03_01055 [Holophagales bacterium]|nr:hypothetical protein [Holophagales bacterium]